MNIYVWGTGKVAMRYLNKGELNLDSVLGFIETNKSRDSFLGKRVYLPSEIVETDYSAILVLAKNISLSVLDTCKKVGIPEKKLWMIESNCWRGGKEMNNLPPCVTQKTHLNDENLFPPTQFPMLYADYKINEDYAERFIITMNNGFDYKNKKNLAMKNPLKREEYDIDYFRHTTFSLVANEILASNVEGDAAELGVFRGDFSRIINKKFPEKDLYLFDTFESFDKEEFQSEVDAGRCKNDFLEYFKDTSVEKVLGGMAHPERCIIKKGFFPQTAKGCENLRFAFVSIDVDFEKSILEGLRFFYPRLNAGGAIFLHDYNNYFLEGVKLAVRTYEKEIEEQIHKVPIADEGGTLIIVK